MYAHTHSSASAFIYIYFYEKGRKGSDEIQNPQCYMLCANFMVLAAALSAKLSDGLKRETLPFPPI